MRVFSQQSTSILHTLCRLILSSRVVTYTGVPADPEALYAPIKNQIAEAAYTRDVQEWDGTSMKRIFEGRDRKNTGMQRRRSSGVHRSRSSSSTCVVRCLQVYCHCIIRK